MPPLRSHNCRVFQFQIEAGGGPEPRNLLIPALSFCLEHVNFRLWSNTYSKTKESKNAFCFARKNAPSGNPP